MPLIQFVSIEKVEVSEGELEEGLHRLCHEIVTADYGVV